MEAAESSAGVVLADVDGREIGSENNSFADSAVAEVYCPTYKQLMSLWQLMGRRL